MEFTLRRQGKDYNRRVQSYVNLLGSKSYGINYLSFFIHTKYCNPLQVAGEDNSGGDI